MQGASLGLALGALAEALAMTGDFERAIEYAQEASLLHENGGTFTWFVLSLRCEADVMRLAGRPAEAHQRYLRALQLAVPRQMRFSAFECLAGLAALASDAGRHEDALRLTAAAGALRVFVGAPAVTRGPDLVRIEATARENLDADAAERAYAHGAEVDLQQLDRILG
jgi:tetratricopeptide (TPR) repeat protein